jgi:hypothetical protein
MKKKLLNHINHIHKDIVPTPDAAGGYYQYPIQSIMTIIKNGKITLSLASLFNITKNDFKPNKEFSSVELIELSSKGYKYNYSVELILNKEDKASYTYKDSPEVIKYRNQFIHCFQTFTQANEFYIQMVDKFNLKENIYSLYRYQQHIDSNTPEYTYDEYIKLITTNVNTLI